jgi:hypothetical protein
MDKRTTIKNKLNSIFCDLSKGDKKYSEVWLSDVDFGELYQSDKYVLNVKAEHSIDSCKDEIDEILDLLNEKANEELQSIWQVRIFDSSDEVHCASDEILIYSEETSCK